MISFVKMGLDWFEEENEKFILEHVNCGVHVRHPCGDVQETVGNTALEVRGVYQAGYVKGIVSS